MPEQDSLNSSSEEDAEPERNNNPEGINQFPECRKSITPTRSEQSNSFLISIERQPGGESTPTPLPRGDDQPIPGI